MRITSPCYTIFGKRLARSVARLGGEAGFLAAKLIARDGMADNATVVPHQAGTPISRDLMKRKAGRHLPDFRVSLGSKPGKRKHFNV
jgi:hypothetical protein